MCLSIPLRISRWLDGEGALALAERPGRTERLNMLLTGPQAVGTWVLASLGFAQEVVEEEDRILIEAALAELADSLDGLAS